MNVSSILGSRAFKNILAYSITKAALDQFTRCTAMDLADKGTYLNEPKFVRKSKILAIYQQKTLFYLYLGVRVNSVSDTLLILLVDNFSCS